MFPADPYLKFRVRQLCETVNAAIQPLQNISVIKKIENEYSGDGAEWARYFITKGLGSYEMLLQETKGKYSVGDEVTAADAFLLPQLFNANRYKIDLSQFPLICEVAENLNQIEEIKQAHPTNMPDTPEDEK